MSFQFSLKGKISKPARRGEPSKRNPLSNDENPINTKNAIDTFDSKKGAMLGKKALSHKPNLVIKPIEQSTKLRRKTNVQKQKELAGGVIDISKSTSVAALSLINGQQLEDVSTRVINLDPQSFDQETENLLGAENTLRDYEEVPVEEFGSALLRGMGWKGPDMTSTSLHLNHRQRGVVLGIGAKSVTEDLEQELLDRKNLSVPLIKGESKNG